MGCGSSGAHDESEGPTSDPSRSEQPGVVKNESDVTGRLVASDGSPWPEGYEIWLLDHSDGSFARFPLASSGEIALPLSIFRADHFYTLHLLYKLRLLGTFDFGESTDGTQATLIYDNGYGFSLGEITVPMTKRSEVDESHPNLLGSVSGGFQLDPRQNLSFANLMPPAGVEAFAVASQLIVFDPVTLLYGFYLKDLRPIETAEQYAEALKKWSRVGVSLQSRSKDSVVNVYLDEGPEWMKGSRLAKDGAEANRGSSSLWSSSKYSLTLADDRTFAASVFTGRLPTVNSIAIFKVQPESGPTLIVPRLLERVYAQPPKPVAVAIDGSDADPVKNKIVYDEADRADGLLTPVCFGQAPVSILYELPRDTAGRFVTGPGYSLVEVILDYFGEGADGRLTSFDVDVTEYPGQFSTLHSDVSSSEPTRSWDPGVRTVAFSWAEPVQESMTTAQLKFWPEIMLRAVRGYKVSKIRLRTYFRNREHTGVAASAMWFEPDC